MKACQYLLILGATIFFLGPVFAQEVSSNQSPRQRPPQEESQREQRQQRQERPRQEEPLIFERFLVDWGAQPPPPKKKKEPGDVIVEAAADIIREFIGTIVDISDISFTALIRIIDQCAKLGGEGLGFVYCELKKIEELRDQAKLVFLWELDLDYDDAEKAAEEAAAIVRKILDKKTFLVELSDIIADIPGISYLYVDLLGAPENIRRDLNNLAARSGDVAENMGESADLLAELREKFIAGTLTEADLKRIGRELRSNLLSTRTDIEVIREKLEEMGDLSPEMKKKFEEDLAKIKAKLERIEEWLGNHQSRLTILSLQGISAEVLAGEEERLRERIEELERQEQPKKQPSRDRLPGAASEEDKTKIAERIQVLRRQLREKDPKYYEQTIEEQMAGIIDEAKRDWRRRLEELLNQAREKGKDLKSSLEKDLENIRARAAQAGEATEKRLDEARLEIASIIFTDKIDSGIAKINLAINDAENMKNDAVWQQIKGSMGGFGSGIRIDAGSYIEERLDKLINNLGEIKKILEELKKLYEAGQLEDIAEIQKHLDIIKTRLYYVDRGLALIQRVLENLNLEEQLEKIRQKRQEVLEMYQQIKNFSNDKEMLQLIIESQSFKPEEEEEKVKIEAIEVKGEWRSVPRKKRPPGQALFSGSRFLAQRGPCPGGVCPPPRRGRGEIISEDDYLRPQRQTLRERSDSSRSRQRSSREIPREIRGRVRIGDEIEFSDDIYVVVERNGRLILEPIGRRGRPAPTEREILPEQPSHLRQPESRPQPRPSRDSLKETPKIRIIREYSQERWFCFETDGGLLVCYQNPDDRELAEKIAQRAQEERLDCTRDFGKDQPTCTVPVQINIYANESEFSRATGQPPQSPGHSSVQIRNGQVVTIEIDINAHPVNVNPIDVAIHEMTHVVISSEFMRDKPVDRWADEGLAINREPVGMRESHRRNLEEARRKFSTEQIMNMKRYPRENLWGLFYAQSAALVEFLVDQGGEAKFINFLKLAQKVGYKKALEEIYGLTYEDLDREAFGKKTSRGSSQFPLWIILSQNEVKLEDALL